jgi:hypothetical protein
MHARNITSLFGHFILTKERKKSWEFAKSAKFREMRKLI